MNGCIIMFNNYEDLKFHYCITYFSNKILYITINYYAQQFYIYIYMIILMLYM